LQGEVNSLQAKIDALPGWKKVAFGTIGRSFSGFNNWYSRTAQMHLLEIFVFQLMVMLI
jgi:hypothetical protein